MLLRFIITVVFGFLWWWVYNRVGAGLTWLMILGSVLAVCACCCKGGGATDGVWRPGDFNYQGWLACIRRCWPATLVLMIALIVLGLLVFWFTTGMFPTGADLTNILLAAIFAPWLVRIICCAYD